jgi:hypothetical protein
VHLSDQLLVDRLGRLLVQGRLLVRLQNLLWCHWRGRTNDILLWHGLCRHMLSLGCCDLVVLVLHRWLQRL